MSSLWLSHASLRKSSVWGDIIKFFPKKGDVLENGYPSSMQHFQRHPEGWGGGRVGRARTGPGLGTESPGRSRSWQGLWMQKARQTPEGLRGDSDLASSFLTWGSGQQKSCRPPLAVGDSHHTAKFIRTGSGNPGPCRRQTWKVRGSSEGMCLIRQSQSPGSRADPGLWCKGAAFQTHARGIARVGESLGTFFYQGTPPASRELRGSCPWC